MINSFEVESLLKQKYKDGNSFLKIMADEVKNCFAVDNRLPNDIFIGDVTDVFGKEVSILFIKLLFLKIKEYRDPHKDIVKNAAEMLYEEMASMSLFDSLAWAISFGNGSIGGEENYTLPPYRLRLSIRDFKNILSKRNEEEMAKKAEESYRKPQVPGIVTFKRWLTLTKQAVSRYRSKEDYTEILEELHVDCIEELLETYRKHSQEIDALPI